MTLFVGRESDNTKARYVVPTWMDKDGNQRLVASSDSLPTIDVNHLRLHEGRAYYAYKLRPNADKLGTSSSIDIAIAWPANVYAHSVMTYQCGGEAEFYLYEGATTSSGTALTLHRRNRYLTTASQGAAVLAPTVTNTGTEIYAEFISSGQGGTGAGGGAFTFEFVFKPLTTYLIRLTNVNGQAQMAEVRIDWYE
jgi:hypothetical protein